MLNYEHIHRERIVSATAYRVYRLSAYLSIMLLFVWSYIIVEGVPAAFTSLARLLIVAGVVGAGTVFVGMEYFLFRFDDSHPLKQIVWFVVMLFPLLGPALYCLVVYSRSKVVRDTLPAPDASIK
jgi:hypothetical protein